jgi:undecaprenyl-diphosphatase
MNAPSLFQAIILGVLQGITEFLPVSSTAHLRVFPALLGWNDPGAAFTAVSQLGTLAATLVYFRKDLLDLTTGALRAIRDGKPMENLQSRLAFGIVVGTIPIGIFGRLLKHRIEGQLRSLIVVACALIVVGVIMAIAEKVAAHTRDLSKMTFLDAFLIGCGQTAALIPGASRSGSTIATGLFLGLKRETAARFSFILGIPAVAAAGILELKEVVKERELAGGLFMPTMVATVVAFVVGLWVIGVLLRFLQRQSTMSFVVYRILLGATVLALIGAGRLDPNAGAKAPASIHAPASPETPVSATGTPEAR